VPTPVDGAHHSLETQVAVIATKAAEDPVPMSDLGHIIQTAAGTLPLWRDLAIVILAGLVIVCLWFYASAYVE
jgi:hypothetical protein